MLTLLVAADDGREAGRVCGLDMAEHLLGVVELRTLEPLRARHPRIVQHGRMRYGRAQVEVVPDALPERSKVVDGPLAQRFVTVECQAASVAQPFLVEPNLGDMGGGHGKKHTPRCCR